MTTYDEVSDVAQHKVDVENLRKLAEWLGLRVADYKLGLDIGGGLGLHAPWLLEISERVYVSDIIQFGALFEGKLNSGLIEKFCRNNVDYDPGRVEFHMTDAQNLIYRDGLFDFIFSVNAFEHIPNPRKAFYELIRVSRSGALVLIQFDPLWFSAYGHHLWSLNFDPWDHLLMPEKEFKRQIIARGGTEKEIHIFEHEMNRCLSAEYVSLFKETSREWFSTSHYDFWSKTKEEDEYASHPNFKKCLERGYDPHNLLTRGIQFVGVRT